jgi:hypothetical protein
MGKQMPSSLLNMSWTPKAAASNFDLSFPILSPMANKRHSFGAIWTPLELFGHPNHWAFPAEA